MAESAGVEESIDHDRAWYSVKSGARDYVIWNGSKIGPVDAWGLATYAFFRIVNDQLANATVRLYAINGGHDLHGIFLTPAQAKAARSGLPRSAWPYIPTISRPGTDSTTRGCGSSGRRVRRAFTESKGSAKASA